MSNITFRQSRVNDAHYVHINGEWTGMLLNLHAYETIDSYKKQVDKQISEYIKNNE